MSAQGSGLRTRQTKGSPHAPEKLTPTLVPSTYERPWYKLRQLVRLTNGVPIVDIKSNCINLQAQACDHAAVGSIRNIRRLMNQRLAVWAILGSLDEKNVSNLPKCMMMCVTFFNSMAISAGHEHRGWLEPQSLPERTQLRTTAPLSKRAAEFWPDRRRTWCRRDLSTSQYFARRNCRSATFCRRSRQSARASLLQRCILDCRSCRSSSRTRPSRHP